MRRDAAIAAVLALATGALPFTRGAEGESATLQRSRRAGELITGIEAEFAIERAIFEEELDRGVALGQWGEGEKRMAVSSMSYLLGTDRPTFAPSSMPPEIRASMIEHAGTGGDPSQAT